jgi:hypothetical protein
MQIQIAITYDGDSPINPDGALSIDRQDRGNALEPHLFEIVSDDDDEVVIVANIPDRACRFLRILDGEPPACCWGEQRKGYMEDCWPGQAHELICLHCAEYAFLREERLLEHSERMDSHGGVWETLPEFSSAEGERYGWAYIERPRTIHDMDPDDEPLTIQQAAEQLGVSNQAIVSRLDRGTLTVYLDPAAPQRQRRRLVSRKELEAL